MNSNIEALRALIEAMEGGNYITKVEPIEENGVVVGYTISFAEGDPITIYHGKDGKDGEDGKDGANGTGGGAAPQIGIKQDTDGAYYWTLDGEWLLDDNGNKVKAVGEDGKDGEDGITPELKIENDYWYISYDNGASWTELGKAKGEDGQDGQGGQGGSSLFKSVTQDDNYVYFTLSDNSVITIAKSVELSIEFDLSAVGEVTINTEVEVPFAVASASESVDIEVVPTEDLTAEVVAYDSSRKSGHILIRTGSRHDAASKVIVLVSNGDKVIMKTIAVYVKAAEEELAQLYIYNGATKSALASGGVVTLAFMTNVACEAVIPEDVSWLSLDDTRALNYNSIKLRVAQNGGDRRSAKVKVQSLDGALSIEYTITQAAVSSSSTPDVDDDGNILGTPATHEIFYTSTDGSIVEPYDVNVFGAVLLTNTYENGVGVLSFDRPLTIIGQSAFTSKSKITEIVLPDGVEKIDAAAFGGCSALKSINIPDGVKSIGKGAFWNCDALRTITIPDSVTEIISGSDSAYSTFYHCDSLTTVTLGNGITSIGICTFWYCRALTNITIPDSVTSIGGSAFQYCSSLTSITIPDSVTSIGSNAFSGCSSLTSISIPDSVTSIGYYAFKDCSKLESVTLSENLTSISSETFIGCTSLINIYIPNSVTTIGNYAFYGCSALSEVSIGSGVKTIGTEAFKNCTSLISVVIPDNVTTIDKNAFELCRGLERVEIGTGVTKINAAAFRYCYALENIKCKATTPPTIAEDTFFGLGINPVIYVPMAVVDDYKAATYWSDLADIITGYEE